MTNCYQQCVIKSLLIPVSTLTLKVVHGNNEQQVISSRLHVGAVFA